MSDGCFKRRFEILEFRGRMPLPHRLYYLIMMQCWIIKPVGVASSHEKIAPQADWVSSLSSRRRFNKLAMAGKPESGEENNPDNPVDPV